MVLLKLETIETMSFLLPIRRPVRVKVPLAVRQIAYSVKIGFCLLLLSNCYKDPHVWIYKYAKTLPLKPLMVFYLHSILQTMRISFRKGWQRLLSLLTVFR